MLLDCMLVSSLLASLRSCCNSCKMSNCAAVNPVTASSFLAFAVDQSAGSNTFCMLLHRFRLCLAETAVPSWSACKERIVESSFSARRSAGTSNTQKDFTCCVSDSTCAQASVKTSICEDRHDFSCKVHMV